MGPGQTSSRSFRFREPAVRPSQVPGFYDGTDPRCYRHAVVDWLTYQNCCTEGESNYMSHEKRLRALVIGIRSRTRRQLDNFVRAIPYSPPPELFSLLVDHLLHVVDPTDRHTDVLATAEELKNLVCTRAKPGVSGSILVTLYRRQRPVHAITRKRGWHRWPSRNDCVD